MVLTGRNKKLKRKSHPTAVLSTTNTAQTALRGNTGFHSQKPVNNHPRYGTAMAPIQYVFSRGKHKYHTYFNTQLYRQYMYIYVPTVWFDIIKCGETLVSAATTNHTHIPTLLGQVGKKVNALCHQQLLQQASCYGWFSWQDLDSQVRCQYQFLFSKGILQLQHMALSC
jgi:hypothetical protein